MDFAEIPLDPSYKELIKDPDGTLKRLESELATLLTSRASLEHEIETIVNTYQFQDAALISKLPTELISEVLDLVITGQPRSISSLMLVCRSWYKAIINTPRLWTSIHVIVPPHLGLIDACVTHCKNAVQRSGQLPLNITLDYSRLRELDTNHEAQIEKRWIAPQFRWSFFRWSSYYLHINSSDHPLFRHLCPLILKPLITLVGKEDVIMSRWRSFNLIADQTWPGKLWARWKLTRAVFMTGIMNMPTPVLENLSIQHIDIKTAYNNMEEYHPALWKRRTKTPFPDLSGVTTLSLSNIELPINNIRIDPLRLERLDVLCCDLNSYQFALRCQNVTTMTIGLHYYVDYEQDDLKNITHLPFHRLRHLRLSHRPPNFFWKALDAPLLEVLVVLDFFVTHNTMEWAPFPALSRVEFRWPYVHRTWDSFLRPLLINLSTKCPSLETLVCTKSSGGPVKRLIKQVKQMGYDFKSLKTMIMISPNYNEITREVEDMVSWLS
jgi:hypothetical protein